MDHASDLPRSFKSFFKRTQIQDSDEFISDHVMNSFQFLIKVVFALSHINDLQTCQSMPIFTCPDVFERSWFSTLDYPFSGAEGEIELFSCEHEVVNLLTRAKWDGETFLWSDFGWSIWLPVVGERDPSEVEPLLVNVRQGVPTMERSNERRHRIADGSLQPWIDHPANSPLLRGDTYVPRSAASCTERKEFWSTSEDCFELSLVYPTQPSAEWMTYNGVKPFEVINCYRRMFDGAMHGVYLTSACEHAPLDSKFNRLVEAPSTALGPDAVVKLGWKFNDRNQKIEARVLVLLTRGIPALRWAAIQHNRGVGRDSILVTKDCCDACALDLATALEGSWNLIL